MAIDRFKYGQIVCNPAIHDTAFGSQLGCKACHAILGHSVEYLTKYLLYQGKQQKIKKKSSCTSGHAPKVYPLPRNYWTKRAICQILRQPCIKTTTLPTDNIIWHFFVICRPKVLCKISIILDGNIIKKQLTVSKIF